MNHARDNCIPQNRQNFHWSMTTAPLLLLLLGTLVCAELPIRELARVEIYPPQVQLLNPRDTAQLVVTGFSATGQAYDLTRHANYHVHGLEKDATIGLSIHHGRIALDSETWPSNAKAFVQPPSLPFHPKTIPSGNLTGFYDLADDFSHTQNPNAVWKFSILNGSLLNYSTDRLRFAADLPGVSQPGWHASESRSVPAIGRTVNVNGLGSPHDFAEGHVFCHSPIAISWTAPHAGTVTIRGATWMSRDLNRKVPTSLLCKRRGFHQVLWNQIVLPERDEDNDGQIEGPTSTNPYSFRQLLQDNDFSPSVLDALIVDAGDELVWQAYGGDFVGIDWTIQYTTPVPKKDSVGDNKEAVTTKSATDPDTPTEAVIQVKVGQFTNDVVVRFPSTETQSPISFRDEVLAVVTKHGCNAGACHANPNGKGGFHLTLRGFDAREDWEEIVFGEAGRRVNSLLPEKSLLLRKPLMDVDHGGGTQLKKHDLAYSLLQDWIANGCRMDSSDDPICVGITVHPTQRVLYQDAFTQQLVVLAQFSDGAQRDVTPLVTYTSSDEGIAQVSANGLVRGSDSGLTAIMIQYGKHMEASQLSWVVPVPGFEWTDPPESNFVDRYNFAQLRQFQIQPSERCTDDEFIRRVYLDTLGKLPSVNDAKQFLADTSSTKRQALIDAVLERPEYAEFWALKWSDLLRVRAKNMSAAGMNKFHRWILRSIAENEPYDRFVSNILLSRGSVFRNPQANFYLAANTHEDCAETTAELFLGVKIKCAKCHNHPFDRWTQDDYHGLAANFFRVVSKAGVQPGEMVVFSKRHGDLMHPRTNQAVPPWLPTQGAVEIESDVDRRQLLTDWLCQPDNPFFAKVAVNRIWSQLLGRGLVEPVDDFRDSNPAINPPLLDALADEFAQSGFDRKHIIKMILNSHTYQLSAATNATNQEDGSFFSQHRPRRLTAEQLLDAVCQVTLVPELFSDVPQGTRAVSRAAPPSDHTFLSTFGQPERNTACQCERVKQLGFPQALQLVNGPTLQRKLNDPNGRIQQGIAAETPTEELVAELYWSALSRPPMPQELTMVMQHIEASHDPLKGLQDCCWALINSPRFVFEH